MDLGYACLRPFLFRMDAERAHGMTLRLAAIVARSSLLRSLMRWRYAPPVDSCLELEAFGQKFAHPLGLAAGLDKDGVAIDAWAAFGFSFLELGTVTPGNGQPGNDRPRMARMPSSRAVINRLGFPNAGALALAHNMRVRRTMIPVGANIGKAKQTSLEEGVKDYIEAFRDIFPVSNYAVVNVSSPNTPGLRDLQSIQKLEPLLVGVLEENQRLAAHHGVNTLPVLLKIAPDLADEDVDAVAELAMKLSLDGVVATNTTTRVDLVGTAAPIKGGVSGAPLAPRSLELTRRLYTRLGERIPIIGVGGIMGAEDAWRRIRAGARLLQTYTGLIYEGPGLIRSITKGLAKKVRDSGLKTLREAVGADV